MKHIKTPLILRELNEDDGLPNSVNLVQQDDDEWICGFGAWESKECQDAAHSVARACNCHDELLEALELAKRKLAFLIPAATNGLPSEGEPDYEKICAVIARAKGG